MSTFSFTTLCVMFALIFSLGCCGPSFPNVSKKQAFKEEYDMMINEQGWKYKEKVTFDMAKKTVVHDVPAHRNLSKSNVMVDFVSNSTVTRFLNRHVCYIRPIAHEEPSLDVLKKSMEMVSSGKYKVKDKVRKISTHWAVKGPTDMSKLSDEVIDFCRRMNIYDVEEYAKDGAKVNEAISRNRRSGSSGGEAEYVLCLPWAQVRENLKKCSDKTTWVLKCKFSMVQNCFHYVTCTEGKISLVNGVCTSDHKYDDFTCCTPSCP